MRPIKSYFQKLILFGFLYSITLSALAQKPLNPIADNGPKSRIELIRADSLVGDNTVSQTQTFMGNVIFKHRGVLLGCTKAIHNQSSNIIEAYGKVVINQGDTLTIVGDTLLYDGNQRMAQVLGKNVTLRDKKVTLRTTKILYNLNNDIAYYPKFGTINQDSSKLSSNQGYYNTKTKFFNYIGDVEILNPSYTLCTDSLDYDTYSKMAYFKSFTTIKSKDGDLSSYKGTYNINTKVSHFEGRARVSNLDYALEADTLMFDNIAESGLAKGNVYFVSFTDSLTILGKKGIRTGKLGLTKIMGQTLSRYISKTDTLYLSSDTLLIYEKIKDKFLPDSLKSNFKPIKTDSLLLKDKKTKSDSLFTSTASKTPLDSTKKDDLRRNMEKLVADGNVKVFRKDFQSISDSLVYDLKDSTIFFFQTPVIWNNQNQLEADSVVIYMKNNRLSNMELRQNSFVVASDTIKNFNQIKGRKIDAYFDKASAIKDIKVDGNGESLYFALDEKNKIVGLNKVQCSNMNFSFKDKKIKQITFRGNPESMLIPPREIVKPDMALEKFEWKSNKKPTKELVVNGRSFALPGL
ncbi:OstA-like protein [Lacihabitans lacunae]|uniref:OstA-like protein n=1 Tax=Lacihabitans lacunae TaxID=1028214 RepID=A0ABV7YSK1_9BACT